MIAMFTAIPAISQAPGFTELTTIRQIRHLKASTPDIGVHVRGVVTYYDTVAPNLFVQDPTGGIWVDLRENPRPNLHYLARCSIFRALWVSASAPILPIRVGQL